MAVFVLCLILLWAVKIDSCFSFVTSWYGLLPMQVSQACNTALACCIPILFEACLQDQLASCMHAASHDGHDRMTSLLLMLIQQKSLI